MFCHVTAGTRVVSAWDRLSITDGSDHMIPTDEMAARLSKVLGRVVSREDFLAYCETAPEDGNALAALARVLELEVEWLRTKEHMEESQAGDERRLAGRQTADPRTFTDHRFNNCFNRQISNQSSIESRFVPWENWAHFSREEPSCT